MEAGIRKRVCKPFGGKQLARLVREVLGEGMESIESLKN